MKLLSIYNLERDKFAGRYSMGKRFKRGNNVIIEDRKKGKSVVSLKQMQPGKRLRVWLLTETPLYNLYHICMQCGFVH